MSKNLIYILSLFFSASVMAEKITIEAEDGFALIADYVAPETSNGKAVLMLHQCNADRSMYQSLAKSLADEGFHSLALDFRSFGESVTEEVSVIKLRERVKSREEYFEKFGPISDKWPSDVVKAYNTLVKKSGTDNVSFIGASCGGAQITHLATKHKPKSIVYFSAYLREEPLEDYKKVADVPTFIIAADEDGVTYTGSQEVLKFTSHPYSNMITYKGSGHGHPLFEHDPTLEMQMVTWFKRFGG